MSKTKTHNRFEKIFEEAKSHFSSSEIEMIQEVRRKIKQIENVPAPAQIEPNVPEKSLSQPISIKSQS